MYESTHIFKSEKSAMCMVEPLLCDVKSFIKIPEDRFYNLLIAVTEAFNNALVHGNKLNPEKDVTITIKATEKNIYVTVIDQGSGFDPEKLADPRAPENLLKENGRGVFIIKSLINEVQIESLPMGTTITMRFELESV